MHSIAVVVGGTLIFVMLWDTFETIIVPRAAMRLMRLTPWLFRVTWRIYRTIGRLLRSERRRELYFGAYGPLALLLLIGCWALGLIVGFALLHWGLQSPIVAGNSDPIFSTYLYLSGVTFFTLGLGDVTPALPLGRTLAVIEAGVGFTFLAVVIGYLPVLYQAFSEREANTVRVYVRAGTPPTGAALIERYYQPEQVMALHGLLLEWEQWLATLQEVSLSYPMLSLYRSHRAHQSWLAALTTMLDACALMATYGPRDATWHLPIRAQAQITFELAFAVVRDLTALLHTPPATVEDRLPPAAWNQLQAQLRAVNIDARTITEAYRPLNELRARYEPAVAQLAQFLLIELPPWVPSAPVGTTLSAAVAYAEELE